MSMRDQEFDAFLSRALDELKQKQDALRTLHCLGELPRWWFEQDKERLQFLSANGDVLLEASTISIGSYSPVSNTWKWAWSNESVLPALRQKSLRLKELATITGFGMFKNADAFEVDEPMAWEIAAISVMHLDALGCYRMPNQEGPHSFLALTTIKKACQ